MYRTIRQELHDIRCVLRTSEAYAKHSKDRETLRSAATVQYDIGNRLYAVAETLAVEGMRDLADRVTRIGDHAVRESSRTTKRMAEAGLPGMRRRPIQG